MILKLDLFKKYTKIIQFTIEVGNPITESLFFNFKEGYCHFRNEKEYGRIRIEKDENENNIFVDANKFLLFIKNFNKDIEYKKGYFYCDKIKSKLGNYGELVFEEVDYTGYEIYKDFNNISSNNSVLEKLRQSIVYIDRNNYPELDATFIRDNHILATNKEIFYQFKSSIQLPGIDIHKSIMKNLLYILEKDKNIQYKTKDKKTQISIENEFDMIFNLPINLEVPPYNEEMFIKEYDHDTFISCNLNELIETIKFLSPFSNTEQKNIYFHIEDKILKLEVKEPDVNIVKEIEIKDSNITEKQSYLFSGQYLKTLLSHLEGESVRVYLSKGSELVSVDTIEQPNKKLICMLLNE